MIGQSIAGYSRGGCLIAIRRICRRIHRHVAGQPVRPEPLPSRSAGKPSRSCGRHRVGDHAALLAW
jgi:hypothetical protein